MHLKRLRLNNFRNISSLNLEFHPKCNLFIGPNAQGKTNILEAIYFLAFGRSFRLQDYKRLIQWGFTEGFIKALAEQSVGSEEREVHLQPEKKKFSKNGKATTPNQFKSMPVVLFAPEEILLLKETPQARRDYMDGLLSKIAPTYGDHLKRYKRALSQRNKLLKDEFLSRDEKEKQIILWEIPMFEEAKHLIEERGVWTSRLNEILEPQYNGISGDLKKARFVYEPNTSTENYLQRQEERHVDELERGVSLVGPHRDDFNAHLDAQKIQDSGSQGEMRTFTLALKFSEIELFEKVLGESPILLLDDVMSELDKNRNEHLFKVLQNFKGQVFASATSLDLFPTPVLKNYLHWEIKGGAPLLCHTS